MQNIVVMYNMRMDKLANNLTALRKTSGFTQNDISEKLYVSRQAVSKWERGESIPDVDTLVALSNMYNVTIDDLLKSDLTERPVMTETLSEQSFEEVKSIHKKQLKENMLFVAVSLLGAYSLICGIIQTACFEVENIWLIWFTLPVLPPLIFAVVFRHDIKKKWLMFFFDVPFVSGIIFELILIGGNVDGAWISFLLIPLYYAIAIAVAVGLDRTERQKKSKTE